MGGRHRLLRGRDLTDSEGATRSAVALINQTMAKRLWADEDPIGRRCYKPGSPDNLFKIGPDTDWLTIVGVVREVQSDSIAGNNTAVGHRRWLLHPFTTAIGTGATNKANAITVIGPTNAYRPNPAWVSWPSAGWFPSTLEPAGRWSLSSGVRGTSFAGASVRVWRNGAPVKVSRAPVADGYAMPTVVWLPPASVARSGTFKVLVSGIRQGRTQVGDDVPDGLLLVPGWHDEEQRAVVGHARILVTAPGR